MLAHDKVTAGYATQIWEALRELAETPQEGSCILFLDGPENGRCSIVAIGKANVHSASSDDFKVTIRNHNASRVILAHNHPFSSSPQPSVPDVRATAKCRAELASAGIEVEDVMIVSGRGWFSFKESGLLGVPVEDSWVLNKLLRWVNKLGSPLREARKAIRKAHPIHKLVKEAEDFVGW